MNALIRQHESNTLWVAAIGILYIALAATLPLDAPPLLDEPIFASSAFQWAETGTLEVSGLSAPTAIFDTIWGGLFAMVLGPSYEALRWSTITLVALSVPFLFWMLRSLKARPAVAALGVAAYVFNPLALVLSVTFMTDMHAAALATISAALFIRAIRDIQPRPIWLLAGATVAGIGFLSRQQTLVVPIAVFLVLAITMVRHSIGWHWMLPVLIPPFLAYVAYGFLSSGHDPPFIRVLSEQALAATSGSRVASFAGLALIMTVIYTGLVVIPLSPLLARAPVIRKPAAFLSATGVAIVGLLSVVMNRDPTADQAWVTQTGLSAVDRSHLGRRPEMWTDSVQAIILIALTAAAAIFVVAVVSRWPRALRRQTTFLAISIAGFIGTATIASMPVHSIIHDRYWAPIVPLTVTMAIALATPTTRRLALGAVACAGFAVFGWLGTRDGMVAQQEILQFADHAVSTGIDANEFDGGAAWSALTFGIADEDGPRHILSRPGPFWIKFYAVETEPVFGVALEALDGYRILDRKEYTSALHGERTWVYLVMRDRDSGYFIRLEDF